MSACGWCGERESRPASAFCSEGCEFFWKQERLHEAWEAREQQEFDNDPRNW